MKLLLIILGFTLCMIGLWGGSYVYGNFPFHHWLVSPSIITGFLFFVGGILLAVFTIVEDLK